MSLSVIEMYQSGGFFMHPILLVMCLGIAIIVERMYFLYYRYNINGPKLFQQIRLTVLKGDLNRAIAFCDDSPLPSILRAGLRQYLNKREGAFAAMEETALEVTPRIQKRTHYLVVLANISTLLGLLGTIIGLIIAFQAIYGAEPGEKAVQLAKGIAIAMNTTAFGLIVAIPCLLFNSVLQSKANRLLDEIDEYSIKTVHLLDSMDHTRRDAA
ncbi:MAG: MotA/TolQ/ExbB proton channel family protein [bacterium]